MQLKAFPGGWAQHANRHCIWIVSPLGYVHSHAFDEIALALSGAFSELGGSAPVVRDPADFAGRLPIIYGMNIIADQAKGNLPPGSIIVNLEQVSAESRWFSDQYLNFLKTNAVLDYSPRNRENLAKLGVAHAETLEVGYHSALRKIKQQREKDIDVLFYGSQVERRKRILDAMSAAGLRVGFLNGVYGAERDAAIARSKLVLNMHFYDAAVFEIIRVFYLLANATCVLTEGLTDDPDIAPYKDGMAVVPYEGLVEHAIELVKDDKKRALISAHGWDLMRRRPLAPKLKALMEQS